jgi:hypothetical protein
MLKQKTKEKDCRPGDLLVLITDKNWSDAFMNVGDLVEFQEPVKEFPGYAEVRDPKDGISFDLAWDEFIPLNKLLNRRISCTK